MAITRARATAIVFEALKRWGVPTPVPSSIPLGRVFFSPDSRYIFADLLVAETANAGGRLNRDAFRLEVDTTIGEVIDFILIHTIFSEEPVEKQQAAFTDAARRKRSETTVGSKERRPRRTTHSLVRVYYATDRLEIRTEETVQYGGERSEDGRLSYGECEISIPKAHKVGELESPSLFRLELRPNPEKHVTIATIATLAESEFLKAVAEVVGQSESREAFVFVHGFNVTFEDAARRAGQIAFDLQFAGAPLLYSWPSLGKVGDYLVDGNNITWSTPHFVRFLELLAAHSGAARIHIIAHSMGNRAVCDAIKTLSASRGLVVNHLVLAAPDIDAATFCELAGALRAGSRHITLYASSEDKALKLARKIHGHPRAGEPMLILPGLDSIDASAIETDFLSHSYFGNNWPLLSDIHALLSHDTPPAERFGLTEVKDERGKYYTFRRS